MVDPINDIVRQARQGSISAIIQVLNEKLADSGVRTRAMFDQGVLQLLCEAAKTEQLEQPVLVPRVRQILESLQPRNVRRVNINGRIVQEQQLLWLEEIKREPEKLLWSEEITLAKTSFLQRLAQRRQDKPDPKTTLPRSSVRQTREKRVFWRGIIGGASLSLFLLLLGWALYHWLAPKLSPSPRGAVAGSSEAPEAASPSPEAAASPTQPVIAAAADPFAQAVRLAEETVAVGRTADTSAEWLDIASRWQRASDLMNQVPAQDPRYATAQDRVQRYRQNSEAALDQAAKRRAEEG
ncbi:MAG: hypothetical protein IGS50_06465 [Synechococcales cyanobacterium C42_A2020_086]|jgi:hypothetical protein|nr:hypothetical protein [Synechococcales cyanobacterium C42_A2020_086]